MRRLVIAPAYMHAHALARNSDERLVDAGDDTLDEAEKRAERLVLIGHMPLEREIGTVELQQEPLARDRLILHFERVGERIEIGRLAFVVLVQDRRGDDAGRRSRQKRLDESMLELVENPAEIRAFAMDERVVDIADRVDGLGRRETADRFATGRLPLGRALEDPIVRDIGA